MNEKIEKLKRAILTTINYAEQGHKMDYIGELNCVLKDLKEIQPDLVIYQPGEKVLIEATVVAIYPKHNGENVKVSLEGLAYGGQWWINKETIRKMPEEKHGTN
jgi:hypothetical protein